MNEHNSQDRQALGVELSAFRTGQAEDLFRCGAALSRPSRVADDAAPYIVVPDGYELTPLDDTLARPMRKVADIHVSDETSFIALVNLHKGPGTMIYATAEPVAFVAVLNDHEPDAPGWRDHRVSWQADMSVEWKIWGQANHTQMRQAVFAQFIEDNLPDIIEPVGADMLEISRTLEAKKKVNFASSIRLTNGSVELVYEEQVHGTASKGKLQIPEVFRIGIAVLDGGPRYSVGARLRYRIADGNLTMWFDLERPHKVIEDAFQQATTSVAAKTGLAILRGKA